MTGLSGLRVAGRTSPRTRGIVDRRAPRCGFDPIGSLEYRALDGTNGATFVFWKPDSREIGFFTGWQAQDRPDDAGGAPVDVCDTPGDPDSMAARHGTTTT